MRPCQPPHLRGMPGGRYSAGAYSTCYSTVGFNGFDPMSTVLVTR